MSPDPRIILIMDRTIVAALYIVGYAMTAVGGYVKLIEDQATA